MLKLAKVIVMLICLVQLELGALGWTPYLEANYPASVKEDAELDMEGLTAKYNYPLETHFVTTEDEYILCLHRLVRENAPPVFLMHGLLDSSISWIQMGPWAGLGYYLYDEGYDVWMGNARGNFYSRNHTTYNPDSSRLFWNFSWHEIGYYDLPASIDYILEQTNRSKLSYIGHSQGGTTFFVMASMRPSYNEKINVMNALAPHIFKLNFKIARILVELERTFIALTHSFIYEFLPRSPFLSNICYSSKRAQDVCYELFYLILGKDPNMWNTTMAPVALSYYPSGCSLKQFDHYSQLDTSKRFCQFDYGPEENLRRYNNTSPSDYPLHKVTAPVALYYAYNDNIVSVKDMMLLAKQLPNVVKDHLFPDKVWNHATMIWGPNAREMAHKVMLELMRKFV